MNLGFDLLLDDPPLLVINKPGGVLTQAPPGIDSIELRLKRMLAGRRGESPLPGEPASEAPYLGIPHRLDRPASGAMVFATTRRATQRLAQQFERREVRKTYWALVAGNVTPAQGTWRDFVRKIPDQAQAEIVPEGHPEAKEAVLHYKRRNLAAHDISWLEIELETGRMHQIRIQAAARGFAVLGDFQYGSQQPFGIPQADPRELAIALHARILQFRGTAGAVFRVTAPVLAGWENFLPAECAFPAAPRPNPT